MNQPLIGITLDAENGGEGQYSRFPFYALRQNYVASIAARGGVPVLLPHHPESVERLIGQLDGLIVTGGNFDIDPALYGAANRHESVLTKDARTRFEWAITEQAMARDIPVLGICGGHQLINVIQGGTLLQHIPDDIPNALEHQQRLAGVAQGQPHHEVAIVEGTKLASITGSKAYKTNSSHHQAVGKVGKDLVVNARTSDGVIEGIEHTGKRFVLGLEWHPEYEAAAEDRKILDAFLTACKQ